MQSAFRIANLILFIVNIALFALWFSLIRIDALPEEGELSSYHFSEITLLITILGITIGLGALILGGLGFFGFKAVLERAEQQADKTAREVAAKYLSEEYGEREKQFSAASRPLPAIDSATREEDI